MSRVFDLLADLLAPVAGADAQATPATPATFATNEHPCGLAADSTPCDTLRQVATSAPLSQKVAGCRNHADRPESKHSCGLSQVSQKSQGVPTANTLRTCRSCAHRLPAGNCDKPGEAGLLPDDSSFAIMFAPRNHAASCSAFTPKVPAKAPETPYRLSAAEGDAAHAVAWDDAEIARFVARVALLMRRGFNATDADDIAERLHLRDVTGDGRALCIECRHLTGRPGAWYCGNPRAAGVADELPDDLVTTMQCCSGFARAGG